MIKHASYYLHDVRRSAEVPQSARGCVSEARSGGEAGLCHPEHGAHQSVQVRERHRVMRDIDF